MDYSILFGLLAMIAAAVNVVLTLIGRDAKVFMFLSLSLTALAICFAYDSIIGQERDLVLGCGNWFAAVGASILINSIALFRKPKR